MAPMEPPEQAPEPEPLSWQPAPAPAPDPVPAASAPPDATLVNQPAASAEQPSVAGGAPAATQTAVAEEGLAAELRGVGLGALQSLTPTTPAELTARVGTGVVPAVDAHHRWARLQAFNWRLAIVRLLCSGLAVVCTVAIVPGLQFTRWRWGTFVEVALIFGLLNALVKPVLQFLVLRFIFSTYGLVVVLINTFLLWALDKFTDGLIDIKGLLPAFLGGLGVGVFGLLFETLLGANPPIMDSRNESEATHP